MRTILDETLVPPTVPEGTGWEKPPLLMTRHAINSRRARERWEREATPEQKTARKKASLKYRRAWYHGNKVRKADKMNDWRLRAVYGITAADRARMFLEQEGRCLICRRSDLELVVDHCHKRKRARALLCRACNLMIGYAHESPEVLNRAIAYLTLFETGS